MAKGEGHTHIHMVFRSFMRTKGRRTTAEGMRSEINEAISKSKESGYPMLHQTASDIIATASEFEYGSSSNGGS